jgi:DNA-binding NarL/FixJ family response regulator
MSVRVLIADDSPFWREELRALLEHDTAWTVFEACDGLEAVRKTAWIYLDAVILDFCMPYSTGSVQHES